MGFIFSSPIKTGESGVDRLVILGFRLPNRLEIKLKIENKKNEKTNNCIHSGNIKFDNIWTG